MSEAENNNQNNNQNNNENNNNQDNNLTSITSPCDFTTVKRSDDFSMCLHSIISPYDFIMTLS